MVVVPMARPGIKHRTEVNVEFNPTTESPTAFCERMIIGVRIAMRDPWPDTPVACRMFDAAERVAKKYNLSEMLNQIHGEEHTLDSVERDAMRMYPQP